MGGWGKRDFFKWEIDGFLLVISSRISSAERNFWMLFVVVSVVLVCSTYSHHFFSFRVKISASFESVLHISGFYIRTRWRPGHLWVLRKDRQPDPAVLQDGMAASIPQLSCPGLISRSQSALSEDGAASCTPQRPTLLTASKAMEWWWIFLLMFGRQTLSIPYLHQLFLGHMYRGMCLKSGLLRDSLKSTWICWKKNRGVRGNSCPVTWAGVSTPVCSLCQGINSLTQW